MSNKKILNTAELARYLGLSKTTLYTMIKDGRFSVKPIQGTDPKLWSVDKVKEWMNCE